MRNREISNSDDMIDSRDVIERIETLEAERDDFGSEGVAREAEEWAQAFPDEAKELADLKALADEAEGYAPDWKYGAQLIRDTYFVEAMQELCEDIGDMPKGFPSYIEIDWEATAKNLQVDYTSVDFDGVTYWVR